MRVFLKGLFKAILFVFVFGTLALLYNPEEEVRSKCTKPSWTLDEPDLQKGFDWNSPKKQGEYHSRFWDLIETNADPNYANYSPKTSPIFRRGQVDNLWRPVGGLRALKRESNSRLVSQMVWQMEAERFFKEELGRKEIKTKTIILPDGFSFWRNVYGLTMTPADCGSPLNSIAKCVYTENMSDLAHADAIVSPNATFLSEVPTGPRPHLLKFFSGLEPPYRSITSLTHSNELLTTYWRGADVVTPYGKWVPYDSKRPVSKVKTDYSKGKTKPAAVFMSDCYPWNNRLGYIKALQQHIDVDIYGDCGYKTCKIGDQNCFRMLKRDYYFYLSFENSNCRDYITEKFFGNALKNDLIPIVMGAHPDDYKVIAPQGSYIHVEDFSSTKELAERMTFLIQNPSEYNKYFEWKGTGEFIPFNQMCQICAMLHYADIVSPPKRTQPFPWNNVHPTFDEICLPKGQWYWSRCVP